MSIYNEIYVKPENLNELFNTLTVQEKLFVYFMHRAILPFNKIYRDQNHRYTNEIIELFEFLYKNKKYIYKDLEKD